MIRAWSALAWDVTRRLLRGSVLLPLLGFLVLWLVFSVGKVEVVPIPGLKESFHVKAWGTVVHNGGKGVAPVDVLLYFLGTSVAGCSALILLVLVILTADAVPRAFLPGQAETTLTKPLTRDEIVLARAAGANGIALALVLTLAIVTAAGGWARSGLSTLPLGLAVVPLVLAFATLHSIASAAGVALRNPQYGLVGSFAALALSLLIVFLHFATSEFTKSTAPDSEQWFPRTAAMLGYARLVFPRPTELLALGARLASSSWDGVEDVKLLANGVAWPIFGYLWAVFLVRRREF